MTEHIWLEEQSAYLLIDHVCRESSDRKVRLFTVACCRSIWTLLDSERARNAVTKSEDYADRLISRAELRRAWFDSDETRLGFRTTSAERAAAYCARFGKVEAPQLAMAFALDAANLKGLRNLVGERAIQANLLRDIFGNPFRPVTFDPSWRTANVLELARTIYDERAFERLPILADALMDAGCSDEQILEHCRSDGPHVRGCWVVDAVLGKE